jgi:ribosomal protein S18 acetylase RimI-like enzyme
MEIVRNANPNVQEVRAFFTRSMAELNPEDNIFGDTNQDLGEWFEVESIPAYLPWGTMLEVREGGVLVGGAFVGMQNPLTWPDGNKAELFILAVDPDRRGRGVGSLLITEAEAVAKDMGARKLIVNTHALMISVQEMYENRGYVRMGALKDYYDNGDGVFLAKDIK